MKRINKEELHSIFDEIKSGNELELNKLYEKYRYIVYGTAFSFLKNKEDSEEIVQMVFLKIFRLKKEKLPTKNEASWLYQVTKNEVINFLKNKKQEINIEELYYITDENKELNEIIDNDTYNKIISRLNEKEQEIVSLKLLTNLSFKEISQILNIPIGTVQWRYYKSIHTLKILLSNLSMFIITMAIFIMEKLSIKKDKNEEIKEDETYNSVESSKQETLNKDEINILKDTVITTDTIKVEPEVKTKFTTSDIGMLSVSGIFLITTIIFLIIFIKYQQKAKKKLSK